MQKSASFLELTRTESSEFTMCLHSLIKWSLDICELHNDLCSRCKQEHLSVATDEIAVGTRLAAKSGDGCVAQPGPLYNGSSSQFE